MASELLVHCDLQGGGQTALHIASAEGDELLLKYFYGVRADASISDNQGKKVRLDRTVLFLWLLVLINYGAQGWSSVVQWKFRIIGFEN